MARRASVEPVYLSWAGKRGPAVSSRAEFALWERFNGPAPENFLYHADNLDVIAEVVREKRRPHLIYIDPPYAMRATHGVRIDEADAYAYDDSWSGAAYCQFMYERLALMREALHDEGFLFVHCDWRASAWLRVMLDELFGRDCFRNEVVWRRAPNLGRQARSSQLGRCVDSILVFSKSAGAPFRGEVPARSTPVSLTGKGTPKGARWDARAQAWFTTAPRGDYTDASMKALAREGRVHTSPSGTQYVKYFLRTGADGVVYKDAPLDTLWHDEGVPPLRYASKRELGVRYVTQKPEALLERIIRWATREGDLVADFFAGSGTTPAVAERLGRRWIACDSGALAVHTIRKRLLERGAQLDVLVADAGTLGSATARVRLGRISVSGVQWPKTGAPGARLRVTRAKHGTKQSPGESLVDLIVAKPDSPTLPCAYVTGSSGMGWRAGESGELHIYDAAGRCAVARVGDEPRPETVARASRRSTEGRGASPLSLTPQRPSPHTSAAPDQ